MARVSACRYRIASPIPRVVAQLPAPSRPPAVSWPATGSCPPELPPDPPGGELLSPEAGGGAPPEGAGPVGLDPSSWLPPPGTDLADVEAPQPTSSRPPTGARRTRPAI